MPKRTPRARYLTRRGRRGLTRPQPAIIANLNADSVDRGPAHVRRAIRALLRLVPNDTVLVGITEASDAAIDTIRRHRRWAAYQTGDPTTPDAALAFYVNTDRARVDNVRLIPGTPKTSEGGGFRHRPYYRITLTIDPGTRHRWRHTFTLAHAHASRAPIARGRYLARLLTFGGTLLGDVNLNGPAARRLFGVGRRVHMAGVLMVAAPRRYPTTAKTIPSRLLEDTGHAAQLVTYWQPPR